MNKDKYISFNVIRRLPKYHSYLADLKEKGVSKVSSKELSKITGFTASQIRQDLNNFGGFGIQGTGYEVEGLYTELSQILGLNSTLSAVIFGAGNLGHAIANYTGFNKFDINIKAIFDVNKDMIGRKIKNTIVMDLKDAKKYIDDNKVKIAIICTPKDAVSGVVDIINKTKIKGVWNFAPTDLKLNKNIKVESVNLLNSLFVLSYLVKANDM
ncbi:redox-sensing transcriptional repressor Rex [Criibacterium bergeronii]|uniref:Redox-sensing transcriptional repressor Rex n=1 Tax=Criibacterium bergeronii TaxID=1871336 RepID=A0A371IKK9_9FIRM|nr:redox-sensing transcriptional repressor Rex [Criibacterium bergeronii]MBS6063010.1 redox-sensing transcriptional repressor Rex [Peptostreptococcaceae bacterium]RDY21025.1 redox-sensing transcriptional repressor Rex [Criibacterium bergeronii]TRW25526.1 redox-sensing transcriptional repressor Rex [Criibacterium bergeronii]